MPVSLNLAPEVIEYITTMNQKGGIDRKVEVVGILRALENIEARGPRDLIISGTTHDGTVYLLRVGKFAIVLVQLKSEPNTLIVTSIFDVRDAQVSDVINKASEFLNTQK
jgi:hypothetical protein